MTTATATFDIKEWKEQTWDGQPYADVDAPKLTRAENVYTYQGDFEGESKLQYLMQYNADGTVYSVALEQLTGRLAGRRGTFVVQHEGLYDGVSNTGTFTIIPGSGTGELSGITGSGSVYATHEVREITFDYELEN
jgi:hypothetical protein